MSLKEREEKGTQYTYITYNRNRVYVGRSRGGLLCAPKGDIRKRRRNIVNLICLRRIIVEVRVVEYL